MKASRVAALEVKVGISVLVLLVISTVVIFLLGKKSNLFAETVHLRTSFNSASGLRVGAQVRLAGVQVGQVSDIHFPDNPRDRRIVVDLRIRKEVLPRITTESKARIDSMGLLGDKIIDISVGTSGQPIAPESMLPGQSPPEYLQLLDKARDILSDVRSITRRLSQVITLYGDPKLHEDITSTVRSVRNIVAEVEHGRGLAHALLYDRTIPSQLRRMLQRAGTAADRFGEAGYSLAKAFGQVGRLLKRVQTTKGTTIYTLLFGKDRVTKVFQTAQRAAEGFLAVIDRIRNSKGLLNVLVEGRGGQTIVNNLVAATDTMRRVMARLEQGKGSVGKLLVDSTLYEDLKRLVGNLQRNRLLRSLIRFAIQRKEAKPPPPNRPKELSNGRTLPPR